MSETGRPVLAEAGLGHAEGGAIEFHRGGDIAHGENQMVDAVYFHVIREP